MSRLKNSTKKIIIGISGAIVILSGILMVPYPGPGWLVVFAGFAILATEFEFADNVLKFLRIKYDQWQSWIKRQNGIIRFLVLALTGIVVVLTIWLVNGFGIFNAIFRLDQLWLISPIFR